MEIFYPDAHKMIPRHIPEALGNCVAIKACVDDNHIGNMTNRGSNYGIIFYVNNLTHHFLQ